MGWKGNKQIVTFDPSPWYRYIFFSSLNDTDFGGIQAAQMEQIINKSSLKKIEQKNGDDIISYIDNYIKQLRAWAASEANQEINFLQLAKKYNMNIRDYQKGKSFNYLDFIEDLNQAYMNINNLKSIIDIHSTNLNNILSAIDNFSSDKQYAARDDKKTGVSEDASKIPFINSQSIQQMHHMHDMQRTREGVLYALEKNSKKVSMNSFNLNSLKDQIRQILFSESVITEIKNAITAGQVSKNILKKRIFSIVITALERNKNNDPQEIIRQVTTEIAKLATQDIEESYSNAMTWIEVSEEETIENMINQVDKSGENLANLFENLSLDVQKALIGDFQNQMGPYTKIQEIYRQFKDSMSGDDKQKISTLKGQFSKQLRAEIKKQISGKTKILKSKKDKLIKNLSNIANNGTGATDTRSFLTSCINNFDITGFDYAEIKAGSQASFQEGIKAFMGGKKIQLKGDLYVSYFLKGNPYQKLIDTTIQKQYNQTVKQIENFGKDFLEAYNDKGKGATNVSEAEAAYKEQLQKLAQSKKQLLDKVTNETDKKKIEDIFQFLSTSISVKKYEDITYINEGFHGGSLGGGGRVVEAIPNIVKMLDAGGISLVDANTIIGALLNSFDGSLIGTGHEQPLKDYLVAGAAMVLFDDGFANGKRFLQQLSNELRAVAPGALHLIFVNDMYYPQSFILTEICNNLEQLESEITKTQNIYYHGANRTYVVLNNPLNYNVLKKANEKHPGSENEAARWEDIGEYARDKVTIDLFFMAGMLDVLDALKQKLGNVDNIHS